MKNKKEYINFIFMYLWLTLDLNKYVCWVFYRSVVRKDYLLFYTLFEEEEIGH